METSSNTSQLEDAFNPKYKVSKAKEDRADIISFAFDEFIYCLEIFCSLVEARIYQTLVIVFFRKSDKLREYKVCYRVSNIYTSNLSEQGDFGD